jgi:hypothetical protein
MRKADFAEWILSLTTTSERAATTAGDLAEVAGTRGMLWFCWNLFKTTASLVWRAFADDPLTMVGTAVKACLFEILMVVGGTVVAIAGSIMISLLAYSLGVRSLPSWLSAMTIGLLATETIVLTMYFVIGRYLARRLPGRVLAALIAFECVEMGLWAALHFLLPARADVVNLAEILPGVLMALTIPIALLAGIDQGRKKTAERRHA